LKLKLNQTLNYVEFIHVSVLQFGSTKSNFLGSKNIMHKFLFSILNPTLGKLIRFMQSMSLQRRTLDINDLLYEFAIRNTAEYVYQNMQSAIFFERRESMWEYLIDNYANNAENIKQVNNGFVAEFGTYKGYSINYIAKKLPERKIYGFDSFKGLNEHWYGTKVKKGEFNLNGILPSVEKNVILFPGLFEKTIPVFLAEVKGMPAEILHIDSDTYESCELVLRLLQKKVVKGTIIIFDEFFGYPNFKAHEFRAWNDFVLSNRIKYKWIAYTQVGAAALVL